MKKLESKWQTVFNKYLRQRRAEGRPLYGIFELKNTEIDSIPFNCLEDGQKEGLPAVEKEGLIWKLSDADPRLKPGDCISTPPLTAYIVIKYPKKFIIIPIQTFFKEEKESERKSLTLERAEELAFKILNTHE